MAKEMTDNEAQIIAEKVAEILISRNTAPAGQSCPFFSDSERESLKSFLRTRARAAKVALWIFGAVLLWILKDAYQFVHDHVSIFWGK